MNAGSIPWSAGDVVSIFVALAYLGLGLWLKARNRTAERMAVLLGTGLSLGPLLLIVADPILQVFGLRLGLVALVLAQTRLVLWWAAAMAAITILRDLFREPAV